jgi:hypothetical protein
VSEIFLGAYKGGGDAGAGPAFKAANAAAEASADGRNALLQAYLAEGGSKNPAARGAGTQINDTDKAVKALTASLSTTRGEITALKQQLSTAQADTTSALASLSAKLEGLETGTGTSVGEIARAVVAELKKEGN